MLPSLLTPLCCSVRSLLSADWRVQREHDGDGWIQHAQGAKRKGTSEKLNTELEHPGAKSDSGFAQLRLVTVLTRSCLCCVSLTIVAPLISAVASLCCFIFAASSSSALLRRRVVFSSLPARCPSLLAAVVSARSIAQVVIKVWDMGGQEKYRGMWERYCRGVEVIVSVTEIEKRAEQRLPCDLHPRQCQLIPVFVSVHAVLSLMPTIRNCSPWLKRRCRVCSRNPPWLACPCWCCSTRTICPRPSVPRRWSRSCQWQKAQCACIDADGVRSHSAHCVRCAHDFSADFSAVPCALCSQLESLVNRDVSYYSVSCKNIINIDKVRRGRGERNRTGESGGGIWRGSNDPKRVVLTWLSLFVRFVCRRWNGSSSVPIRTRTRSERRGACEQIAPAYAFFRFIHHSPRSLPLFSVCRIAAPFASQNLSVLGHR